MESQTASPVNQAVAHFHTPAQTETSSASLFGGHTLSVTAQSMEVKNQIKESCSICLDPLTSELSEPVQILSCRHVYHQECIELALARSKECPECRADVKENSTKVYSSTDELVAQLPKECSDPICTAKGTEQEISEQAARCPAPLSTLPHQEADQFLEKNSKLLIQWLNQQFKEKNYSTSYAAFDETYFVGRPDLDGKPAIKLDVQFSGDSQIQKLYYSSVDINKGNTPKECFKNLLLDLRTDLVMLYLRESYPAMFNQRSELFIKHYDLWNDDKIFLNNYSYSIPLTTVFNPETKSFSWDKLKEEIEKLGLSYQDLFSSKRANYYSKSSNDNALCLQFDSAVTLGGSHDAYGGVDECDGPVDFVDNKVVRAAGGSSRSTAVARKEVAPEIPSGMMDTEGLLF